MGQETYFVDHQARTRFVRKYKDTICVENRRRLKRKPKFLLREGSGTCVHDLETFNKYQDKNINADEFLAGVRDIIGISSDDMPDEMVGVLMQALDSDSSGTLDIDELLSNGF